MVVTDIRMEIENQLSRLGLALGIGLLIGLERGWQTREAAAGSRTAGVRTFAISGLLGGIVGAISVAPDGAMHVAGSIVLGVAFVSYAALVGVFCYAENRADKTFSATTPIAAVLTFSLGAYALIGNVWTAAAAAVAATAILAAREGLHGWIGAITWPELRSGLILLAMTFVALPLVPSDPIGPFGGVNLREVWIVAITLALVSFLGYVAVKHLGPQGVLLAAALGGIVSSTAVTIASARRTAAGESSPHLSAAATAIASAVMFARVVAIVAAIMPALLVRVAPALVVSALTALGLASWWATRGAASIVGEQQDYPLTFRNPLDLRSVLGFALFLAVIMVLSRVVGETVGATGVLVGAIIAGLADVDAITVATARLVPNPLRPEHAALAILAAVLSDTVSKVCIGAVIERSRFALLIAAMAAACLCTGAAALAFTLALLGINSPVP
jgi:uncharacterized membrane protein (DUF4010 family)